MGTRSESDAVVVPTGFDPGSYPCVQSLSRRGVRTIVASEHENVMAAASRFCDESVVIPPPDDDLLAYRDALLGLPSARRSGRSSRYGHETSISSRGTGSRSRTTSRS